ncbi:MAG: nicotinate phosphoribosyltransferase [Candidatus Wolframiiraptor sp.]|nr:MAG: nicotinate phosphoribosyltransferase [Candidatus Wolframiiraptor sp.]
MKERKFYIATEEEILSGKVTDIYFARTREILERTGKKDKRAYAEIHAYGLPKEYKWAIAAGIGEAAKLLEGKDVDVYALEEGEFFRVYEPVMAIDGKYVDYGIYESSLLGILRHATSVATKAARLRIAAGDKTLLFFGIRSVHPALAPMVDRYALMGGCDAVSSIIGAELAGVKPVGTMPHALILIFGNQPEAWKAFDSIIPEEVPRITLCDTLSDERFEALLAAEVLKDKLYGVRFDTPGSRRGNMRKIVLEARWALDLAGYKHVKIFVSGGLNEEEVRELSDVADGFGVGTSIAFPPSVDLAMDIVEVDGKSFSKRGKLPGRKQVYRCRKLHDTVTPFNVEIDSCPICGERVEPLLKPLIRGGKLVRDIPTPLEVRERVIKRLRGLTAIEEFQPEPRFLIP